MTDNIFRDLMSYSISASAALHVPTCRRRTFLSRAAYQSICNLIFHGALTPMISFSITHFYVVFLPLPPPVSCFPYRSDMSHPKTAKRQNGSSPNTTTRDTRWMWREENVTSSPRYWSILLSCKNRSKLHTSRPSASISLGEEVDVQIGIKYCRILDAFYWRFAIYSHVSTECSVQSLRQSRAVAGVVSPCDGATVKDRFALNCSEKIICHVIVRVSIKSGRLWNFLVFPLKIAANISTLFSFNDKFRNAFSCFPLPHLPINFSLRTWIPSELNWGSKNNSSETCNFITRPSMHLLDLCWRLAGVI